MVSAAAAFQTDLFAVRAAQLLAVGMMLVYFGMHQEQLLHEIGRLTAWPVLQVEHHGSDGRLPIRPLLAYVAELFEAPRVLLVWSDPEEPWTYTCQYRAGRSDDERFPPAAFDPPVAKALADRIFMVEPQSAKCVMLDSGGSSHPAAAHGINPALQQRFQIGSAISLPISGDIIEGRLFVLDKKDVFVEDLWVAAVVGTRIGALMEHLAALHLWRRAAAAEERLRLARDLHDGILQVLAGTTLQLQALAETGGSELPQRVGALQGWLTQEQRELRSFIRQLEPGAEANDLGSVDLAGDLDGLAEKLRQQWGMQVDVLVEPAGVRLPARFRFDLYQLVREATANAAPQERFSYRRPRKAGARSAAARTGR